MEKAFIYSRPTTLSMQLFLTEKRIVLSKQPVVIARQSTDCRGNPYSVGDAGKAEKAFIYYQPDHPFKVSSPKGEDGFSQKNIHPSGKAPRINTYAVDSILRFSRREKLH